MSNKQTELDTELGMDAYYYSFEKTGVAEIDKILAAVAQAGCASHHTDGWNEEGYGKLGFDGNSPVEWIQNAANDAAKKLVPKKKRSSAVRASTEISEADTEIALDDTVAHWERLSKCRIREEVMGEGFTYKECSLCALFLKHSCNGCPVAKRTGVTHCNETPHPKVWRELNRFIQGGSKTFPIEEVLDELNFLKSLRREPE